MTAVLTIGRLGLDVVLEDPTEMGLDASEGNRQMRIGGDLFANTLLESKALRDQLIAMTGRIVPVTWTGDADIDGYYRLQSAGIDVQSLTNSGFFPFNITLEHVGSDADLAFRSLLTTAVRSNDHGVTLAESEPVHAPPGGHSAYSAVIGSVTRKSEDGDVVVYRDVSDTRPSWSSTPGAYLNGACKVTSGGYVRSGLSHQNDPEGWTLENGLCRVRPRRKSWGYGGSAETPNTNQPLLLPYRGTQYIHFPGSGGSSNKWTIASAPSNTETSVVDARFVFRKRQYRDGIGTDILVLGSWSSLGAIRVYKHSDDRIYCYSYDSVLGAMQNHSFSADDWQSVDDGDWIGIRALFEESGGTCTIKLYTSTDFGTTWTQVDITRTFAGTNHDLDATRTGTLQNYQSSDPNYDLRSTVILDGENGTPLADIDFTDATALTEPFASFTENTGKTVTINRASSGRASTVVDRSMWLHGTDDFGLIQENDLFQFDLTDDFTELGSWRINRQAGMVLAGTGVAANALGYRLYIHPSTFQIVARINDGSNNGIDETNSQHPSLQTAFVATLRRDTTVDQVERFVDGVSSGSPGTDNTTGSLDSNNAFGIGASDVDSTPSDQLDGETHWIALFHESLAATEISELSDWDGTVVNEPSWLRTHANLALYVNADDPDQQAAYMGDNQIINLADNSLTGGVLANETGSIEVEHYNGSDWLSKIWELQTPAGTELPAWEWVSILRNDPEEAIVRLEASVAGGGRNTLDLTLRRGSRFVEGRLTIPSSGTIKVVRGVTEAGQTVTPAGASSAVGVEAAADDDYGNRYLVGAPLSHTADTTIGGVSKGSVTSLGFFIGAELGGSNAQAGDTSESLCLQHLGLVAETVRSLRR